MSQIGDVDRETLARVASWVIEARRILCITGAGVSAESGLPTYRGVGGIYDDQDTDDGIPIELALSGQVFRRDPQLTWRYLLQIENACRGAQPNAAHRVLADWESAARPSAEVWILTQNVDGLHAAAGSEKLIEIHGDLHRLRCTRCPWRDAVADYSHLSPLPSCPSCGALIRPEVILFNEPLPMTAVATLERELDAGFDLVLSVGTSSQFPYIAHPVALAQRQGGRAVEINPTSTAISSVVDLQLRGPAAELFTALQKEIEVGHSGS